MTTTKSEPATTLLKTDALGRVRTPAQRRERWLDEFERSGMSGAKFAEFVGLKYQTFATWVQRRQRQRKGTVRTAPALQADAAKQLRWMEAVLEPSPPPADPNQTPLLVHLPGGARAELTDAKQVALVAA